MDQSLLEEQSKIYKVEGVDENASTRPQKKRKEYTNGEEVSSPIQGTQMTFLTVFSLSRTGLCRSPKRPASTQLYT